MNKAFIINLTIAVTLYFTIAHLNPLNAFSLFWLILVLWSGVCYLLYITIYRRKAKETMKQISDVSDSNQIKKVEAHITPPVVFEMAGVFWLLLTIFVIRSFLYEPFQIPSGSMEPTLRIGDFILVDKNHYRVADPIRQKTIYIRNPVERGDVVVFKTTTGDGKEDWIKRVIGLPGDKVEYNPQTREITISPHCTINTKCTPYHFTYGAYNQNTDYFYHGNFTAEREETIVSNQASVKHPVLQNPQPLDYSANYYLQPGSVRNSWVVPQGQYFMMGDNRDNSSDSRFIGFIPYENIVGKAKYVVFSLDKNATGNINGIRGNRTFTKIK